MLRISLSHPLPPRPRPLTADQVKKVFGGCNSEGGACSSSKDCCQYYHCESGKCIGGVVP